MSDDTVYPYPRPDSPPLLSPDDAETTLNVWLVPKFSMLTLFCLLEPLRVANRFGRKLFAWRLLSADGQPVTASNGVYIDVDGAIGDLEMEAPGQTWHSESITRLMVVSSWEAEATVTAEDRAVLRRLAAHGAWLGGMDTAPFILARAGVLDGVRVAMHWESLPAFRQEFPSIRVSTARFEWDSDRLTGAGGSASIDMMLMWIEQRYGPSLAEAVGRQIVHHRTSEEQPDNQLQHDSRLPRTVVRALAVMEANLAPPLAIPELCRLAGQSQRQLTRHFQSWFKETPRQTYLGMRLDVAQRILADSHVSVTQAAMAAGFSHLATFSRAYRQRFGEPPSATARRGQAH
ncbi:GlxA family transcriptional regulator [Halomonas huangheensis]|uniref:HTH araC/xylS-type domain-containing protein n=1 Tax=Halomonas huangheensis TaxID=1178482 RepID=W1NAV4_9GAMM|nr:GlxA family transcriptional regulator [Halomonas huangheensis]ALM52447.1 transcriptional regulator [Halomonas huangheensis]ERL52628.1 hypothetical protein BJB45_18795 [Halomonas huangheensis]